MVVAFKKSMANPWLARPVFTISAFGSPFPVGRPPGEPSVVRGPWSVVRGAPAD